MLDSDRGAVGKVDALSTIETILKPNAENGNRAERILFILYFPY